MVKRGKSNKYKAVAIALALAATSLTACGDSGKSDDGSTFEIIPYTDEIYK